MMTLLEQELAKLSVDRVRQLASSTMASDSVRAAAKAELATRFAATPEGERLMRAVFPNRR